MFSRHCRAVGIDKPLLGFHYWRKTVATKLENAGVPELDAARFAERMAEREIWDKKEAERKRRRAKQDAEWRAIKRRWAKEDAERAEKDPEWARKVADAQRELERLVLEGKVMLKQKDEGESEV